MGLDVVWVPVRAVLVVGDQHLRPYLANDRDQPVRRNEEVGGPERVRTDRVAGDRAVVLVVGHAAVAELTRLGQVAVVGHPEGGHRAGELGFPVRAERVVLVCTEVHEVGDEHLALLAPRARHERDLGAVGDVARHRRAVVDRLVVGVGVHEQQPPLGCRRASAMGRAYVGRLTDSPGHRRLRRDGSDADRRPIAARRCDWMWTWPSRCPSRVSTHAPDDSPEVRPGCSRVSPDGERVMFLRSGSGTDPAAALWVLDVGTATERLVADPAALLDGGVRGALARGAGPPRAQPRERSRHRRLRDGPTGIAWPRSRCRDGCSSPICVSGGARELPATAPVVDPRPDPTGTRVAYASAGALRVVGTDPDAEPDRALVEPDGPEVTWGLAEFIAGEEMDRYRGFWWAPDGDRLLVERADESPVQRWYIGDPANPATEPAKHAYPAAGTPNADVAAVRRRSRRRTDRGGVGPRAVRVPRHGIVGPARRRSWSCSRGTSARCMCSTIDPTDGATTLAARGRRSGLARDRPRGARLERRAAGPRGRRRRLAAAGRGRRAGDPGRPAGPGGRWPSTTTACSSPRRRSRPRSTSGRGRPTAASRG